MIYLLPIALLALAACNAAPSARYDDTRPEAAAATGAAPSLTQAPQTVPDCKSDALELTLTPSRAQIRLGEPVVVLISLRNCTGAPAEVPAEIDPEYGTVRLTIGQRGEAPYPYIAPVSRETRRRLMVRMPPGTARGAVAHVYVSRTRPWGLSVPGVYRVDGELPIEKAILTAAPIQFSVLPAPDGVSREDLRGVWPMLGRALYLGNATDAAAAGAWIAKQGGAADYLRPFARVADVRGQSEQQYDPASNTFTMPKCSEIARDAARLVAAVPDPYFAANAASRLNRCLGQLGKAAAGRALFDQVRAAHPVLSKHPAIAELLMDKTALQGQ